jgi:hypothetical protein
MFHKFRNHNRPGNDHCDSVGEPRDSDDRDDGEGDRHGSLRVGAGFDFGARVATR